jgi:cell division protein ZapA (FtsZ GTPase activity inhibitor)
MEEKRNDRAKITRSFEILKERKIKATMPNAIIVYDELVAREKYLAELEQRTLESDKRSEQFSVTNAEVRDLLSEIRTNGLLKPTR